ncbi:MAG: dTMP kinase [Candidatus Diapherotrites archaeon]|nr:dTMP kinase [Candidatus Diapherotrites archaeon]
MKGERKVSGTFIAFDGLPGSGKGTQIKKAFGYIFDKSKKYDNILVTDEPTNGPYGLKVRELFKKQKNVNDLKEEIFQTFIDDRAWHIENVILPALEKDFVVLCDRYKYSSIAYQTVQGTNFEKVFAAHKDFLAPDLALIFDVSPEEGFKRIHSADDEKRVQSDNFRELDFIKSIRTYFLDLPNKLPNENIKIIDANKSIGDVFSQIKVQLDTSLH